MTQNYFRELQGVELMLEIYEHFSKLKDIEVTSNTLYTLSVATEQNSKVMYIFIKKILLQIHYRSLISAYMKLNKKNPRFL